MKQHTEIDDFLCTSVHFGWLFGGRRFLVLIIKVTLSELSEASAPSTNTSKLLETQSLVQPSLRSQKSKSAASLPATLGSDCKRPRALRDMRVAAPRGAADGLPRSRRVRAEVRRGGSLARWLVPGKGFGKSG